FSSRRRHTRSNRDWSSDVCSSDLGKGSYRDTAANGFGHGHDVRLYTVILPGKHGAGASHTALDLVQDEEHVILITELSHPLQECQVNRIDASLSLESLHDHRAGMLVHLLLHAVQIIVTGKFHAPYQRFKRRPVGLVSCHSHCAHRAPVEGVFHGDKLIATKALCEGVLSGRLQGTLNGLCSTV